MSNPSMISDYVDARMITTDHAERLFRRLGRLGYGIQMRENTIRDNRIHNGIFASEIEVSIKPKTAREQLRQELDDWLKL